MMIEQLCVNEDIPLESLSDLLNDDSFPKHLRGRIARKETRKEVLLILQQDKSESVRKKVTKVLESK
jgi:predicted lactoylglutathione lyase